MPCSVARGSAAAVIGRDADLVPAVRAATGGISLPEREYYLSPKFKDKLDLYGPHIERMLTLAGVADAKQKAAAIVKLETQLAKAHWTKEDSRDDTKTYNKLSRADLMAKAFPKSQFYGYDFHPEFDRAFITDVLDAFGGELPPRSIERSRAQSRGLRSIFVGAAAAVPERGLILRPFVVADRRLAGRHWGSRPQAAGELWQMAWSQLEGSAFSRSA